jgi:hypothetical protein
MKNHTKKRWWRWLRVLSAIAIVAFMGAPFARYPDAPSIEESRNGDSGEV